MQAPAAPVLEFGASGLVVTYTPPTGAANAALYVHVEEAKKRAVDVDADDSDEPEAKRPARRKRRQ